MSHTLDWTPLNPVDPPGPPKTRDDGFDPQHPYDPAVVLPLKSGQSGKPFRPRNSLNWDELGEIDIASRHNTYRLRPKNTPNAQTPQIGTAKKLLGIVATESPIKQVDRTFSLVSVTFTRDGTDRLYGYTRIWLRGYKGNSAQVMIADGRESPVSFLLESTGESVSVFGQVISVDGTPTDLSIAPSTTVLLDGVNSAPPAPTISQSVTSVALGFQFSYAQLSGFNADVISCYNIYRGTTSDTTLATKIDTRPHDPTALGSIVIQDYPGANLTYFYWVTAVNKAGLESAVAFAGTNSSLFVTNPNLAGAHSSYRPTTNPLTATDAGASATVSIAAFTMRVAVTDISVSSGSVTALSYDTLYYIYYDDPAYAGGAVTYSATTSKATALQGASRFFVGSIKTPLSGGSATAGNNDGGASAQIGTVSKSSPGTHTPALGGGTSTNPLNAYDGNDTTANVLNAPLHATLDRTATEVYSGFTGTVQSSTTSIVLKVKSSVTAADANGAVTLAYSLDQGGSYTNIFSVTGATRAVTTDSVTLTVAQVIPRIWVRMICTNAPPSTVATICNVFEVWLEVTT